MRQEYGHDVLIGRDRESAYLAALLEQARAGTAASVVVRGEAGVGKSALLGALASAAAADATVLRTQGLEAEAPLPFAALHRLLRPVMALRDGLPTPQARALRVAFGEEEGASVEPFLVALATLSMLTTAAEDQAVLCVVDDAHWLDPATADALLFCTRRLGADHLLIVFSTRDGAATTFRPDGIDELVLTGLELEAARALISTRLGAVPAAAVAERLIAETGGNPLALLELPTGLSSDQLGGAAPLPTHLHLSSRVEQAFLDRSRELPAGVQTLLLLAAADDTGQLAVVRRAAAILGLEASALDAALASGLLLDESGSLRFRHPLVRSAIYQAGDQAAQRRSHLALAATLHEFGDAEREVWHLAAAAEGPDPEVAAALEEVASKAQRRGSYAAALTAFERAAELSTPRVQRTGLTLAAAQNAWACGETSRASALVERARQSAEDPIVLGDIARLRGRIEANLGSATDGHRIFVEGANAVHAFAPSRGLEMAVAGAMMRTYGADSGAVLNIGDIEVDSADPARTACLKHLLISMTMAAEQDWPGAVRALDEALNTGDAVTDLDVLGNLGNAALHLGDDVSQRRVHALAVSRAREVGAAMTVVYGLHRLCFGLFVAGDWAAVRSSAEEALALCASLGQRALSAPSLAWLTLLSALQGREDYDVLLGVLDEVVASHPLGILTDPVHDLTRWAKAAQAAADGDDFGASHHLGRVRVPALVRMTAVERIDAAVRADARDQANQGPAGLTRFAEGTQRPWALAALAHEHARTAGPDAAESHFEAALANHKSAGRPYDEARTHLAYGEWLRRAQRRVDAREHLRHAVRVFDDLQARPLLERASAELRASGETARKRDPSTLVQLTPMELKVAQLVSSGLSNKDVAARIWVSPRTVAFHLRNVFAKAGVTSRGELSQIDLV